MAFSQLAEGREDQRCSRPQQSLRAISRCWVTVNAQPPARSWMQSVLNRRFLKLIRDATVNLNARMTHQVWSVDPSESSKYSRALNVMGTPFSTYSSSGQTTTPMPRIFNLSAICLAPIESKVTGLTRHSKLSLVCIRNKILAWES